MPSSVQQYHGPMTKTFVLSIDVGISTGLNWHPYQGVANGPVTIQNLCETYELKPTTAISPSVRVESELLELLRSLSQDRCKLQYAPDPLASPYRFRVIECIDGVKFCIHS